MILFFIAFEKCTFFFFLYKTQVAAFYFLFFALDEGFQWDEGAFILCMSCLFVCGALTHCTCSSLAAGF